MATNLTEDRTLLPVTSAERIQALDVVRGFALLGIFLMNVEFFNRPLGEMGTGLALGMEGIDWFASWFVAYFVQGKFWTIFSLLFGMGFAVMLSRAQSAGREFIKPYLRRITALATFGAAHFIFLWGGDILFSYAVAAGALLILLYGHWKPIAIAITVLAGVAFIPGLHMVGIYAGSLAFIGLVSLYMRSEYRVKLFNRSLPLFSFILLLTGVIAVLAAVILWLLPDGPKEPRLPVTVVAAVLLILSFLSAKYKEPRELRGLRLGAGIYVVASISMIVGGAFLYLTPPDTQEPVIELGQTATADTDAQPAESPRVEEANEPPAKTEAEKKAEKKAEREKKVALKLEEIREEEEVFSQGSYLQAVEFNARLFPEKLAADGGFATILVSVFLIGVWFVQSGVIQNTKVHLPLFRRLAIYGLPFGIGLGLLGSLIADTHTIGEVQSGYPLAQGLATLGNLPACLGYVGMVVLMLHSDTVFSKISVLAPAGRMALTNYLLQSLVSAFIFFGYGLGYWGLPRAWQVVYVFAFFALQVAFSHWWLARYRYGPMEWLWRGFTYRITPAMRR